MKKPLLLFIITIALLNARAQDTQWVYDFGTAAAGPYTSATYGTTYLPAPQAQGGNAGVRASSATEGPIALITNGMAGGSGAELKMTGGATTTGAKFGLAPYNGTTVGSFQCKVNFASGTNGRFVLYFGNGSNFTSGSGINVAQTFAALRFSLGASNVSLDWLLSSTSPNYTTTGLTQTTIAKSQSYLLRFFMNNSSNSTTYINNGTHSLAAGTFDIWLDNVKILSGADPGTGTLPQGTIINGMNFLNVGAGSSAPVVYLDDISYTNFLTATPPPPPATVTNTILNIDYESGTLNSGIPGVSSSHATAPDASYMVQPGATGNWAIAHKMVYGDSAYYSEGAYRSESDAVALPSARFFPGDERRYEFSVLLKDWTPWVSGPTYETTVFQLKASGNSTTGSGVPLQFRTARNAMRLRYEGSSSIKDIIPDLNPYVNQWLHFRVDVLWADSATGYMRTYMKLPGQSNYALVDEKTNYASFAGDVSAGNIGYIKWGGYVLQEGLTRITYHDDIRIFELNNTNNAIALWNNPITDNNPAYLPSPYSPANDVLTTNVVSNSASPSSDFSRNTLTPAGNATLSGRYLLGDWATGSPGIPSSFNDTEYYEFKIAPKPGYQLTLKDMEFYWRTGGAAHPNTYVLRSSLDNFTSNISAPVTVSDNAANTSNFGNTSVYDLADISTTSEITLRMYWYGATAAGTLVGIDNFTFNGNVYGVESTLQIPAKNNVTKNTNNSVCTYTAQSNEFDVTATGNCGNISYHYVLSGATTGDGSNSLANAVFNKGVTTVNWTATDNCGSVNTSFTITVTDTVKPTITAPAIITVNTDAGQCSAAITLAPPAAADNCTVITFSNNAPATFPVGTTTVTWTVTDANGNKATATQTVTVNDTEAPTLACVPAQNWCFKQRGNYTVLQLTANDNCAIGSISYQVTGATDRNGNGNDASGSFNIGISVITWTVTDVHGSSSTCQTTVTVNAHLTASIADVYGLTSGADANTIYLGYGPSSLTYTVAATGGTAPYNYSWDNGSAASSNTVNPIATGAHTFNVTITDALGCQVTASKTVNVTDIRCGVNKVLVCHKPGGKTKTLCIETGSVADHLTHGCRLGSCPGPIATTMAVGDIELPSPEDFTVIASPNPSSSSFQLVIKANSDKPVLITVVASISGKVMTKIQTVSGQSVHFGEEFIPGLYLAEVKQGTNKRVVKLLKQ